MSTSGEFRKGLTRGAGQGIGRYVVTAILTAIVAFPSGCAVGQAFDAQPQPFQTEQDDD